MSTESRPEQEVESWEAGWAFQSRRPVTPEKSAASTAIPEQPAAAREFQERERPPQRSGVRYDEMGFGASAGSAPAFRPSEPSHLSQPQVQATSEDWTRQPIRQPVEQPWAQPGEPPTGQRDEEPAPGRRRGRRARWVVAALVLLGLAGGGTAVALQRQSGDPVASKHLAQQWQAPVPAGDELIGSWLTDTLLVRASTKGGVTAYRLADGSVAWQAAPRGNGGSVPCAMSPNPVGEKYGTVAFGEDPNSCTSLAGVDLATGKIIWTIPLVDTAHPMATSVETYVQDGVAAVVSENFLGGVDLRTGRRVWGFQTRGDYCNAYDWGSPGVVLVDDYCVDSAHPFALTAYDAVTGAQLWRTSQSLHIDIAHVFSDSPLIASVHTAQEDSVRIFDAKGRSRKLAVGNTELVPGNGSVADHAARVVGGVLVTPAQTAQGAEIAAFDLRTGAELWHRAGAVLATDARGEDKVYAVTTSATPQLLQLDPFTGRPTALATLPAAAGQAAFAAGTVYVTPDGGVLELDALPAHDAVRVYR